MRQSWSWRLNVRSRESSMLVLVRNMPTWTWSSQKKLKGISRSYNVYGSISSICLEEFLLTQKKEIRVSGWGITEAICLLVSYFIRATLHNVRITNMLPIAKYWWFLCAPIGNYLLIRLFPQKSVCSKKVFSYMPQTCNLCMYIIHAIIYC